MESAKSEAENHRLIAGVLCLDFANTVNGHFRSDPHEYLKGYSDLVLWGRRAGILAPLETRLLRGENTRSPAHATAAFGRAIQLRESIFRVFSALAASHKVPASDLSVINTARADALAHSTISSTQNGFAMQWMQNDNFDRIIWPIALSAADLLVAPELSKVRACGGTGCDWLFLDTSRNGLRRWCSMDECGNRAKARRFLQRRRRALHSFAPATRTR